MASGDLPVGRAFALNSGSSIREGNSLVFPRRQQLRLRIEGHLSEEGREPPNVQVIIDEKTRQEKGKAYWRLYLADDSGVNTCIRVCNDECVDEYKEHEQSEHNDRAMHAVEQLRTELAKEKASSYGYSHCR